MVTTVESTDKGVWDMHDYSVEDHGDVGRLRHGSQTFYNLLQEAAETHDKKSHDYASDSKPSGNYHFAGEMAVMFSHSPQDAGFIGRLAEKIYRIKNLESSGRLGITESIEDTERDIFTITALWIADRRDRRRKKLEAIQKVQDQMKAGEWTGSLHNQREIKKDEEVRKDEFFSQVLRLVNEFSSNELYQLATYCSRLGSDKVIQEEESKYGKEKEARKSSGLNPAQSTRGQEKSC